MIWGELKISSADSNILLIDYRLIIIHLDSSNNLLQ